VLLDGVGHLPMWEAPERTADALAAFAQRVRGA
jgi:pimeloyl-ACP methyl ester carboxylesterase